MDRIDKFIYLNLDHREDRKSHILSELKKFGIPEEKIIRFSAVKKEIGALGCSLSHMKMNEMFKESGDKIWCFLEDDHYFIKDKEETNKYVNTFLDNPAYDMFLGCTCALKCSGIGDKFLMRVYHSSMTSFYIAKSNISDALIASHKNSARSYMKDKGRFGIPCDHMWCNLMKVFVFTTPKIGPIGGQIEDYSDIRKQNINYSNYIKVKIDRKLEKEEDKEKPQ